MLPISSDQYYLETFPRVVRVGCPARVCIRPLDEHSAFREGETCRIRVLGMTEPRRCAPAKPATEVTAVVENGALAFTHAFENEQEYALRLFRESSETPFYQTAVYALKDDLADRRPYLADFHVHSFYSDGTESPEFVAAMYRQAGYDLIAITDHGTMEGSRRAIRFYDGVPMDFRILPGEEVHSPSNPVHIVHVGGDFSVNERCLSAVSGSPWNDPGQPAWMADTRSRAAALTGLPEGVDPFVHASCLHVLEDIREAGGMSVFCHPFWIEDMHNVSDALTRFYLEEGFADAFELIGGMSNHENLLQIAFYQQLLSEGRRIPVVGNSDIHRCTDRTLFGISKTLLLARGNGRDDVAEAVKNQFCTAMDEYPGEAPRLYGPFRVVRYAQFLYEQYYPLHQELCFEEGRLMRAMAAGDREAAAQLAALKGRTIRRRERFFTGV